MAKIHLFFIILSIFLSDHIFASQMTVYFIDVGQGDAEYLELPNGKNALIDGGPSQTKIKTFLDSKGITSIDHVVLTHPHADHCTGLEEVFDSYQVNNFYDTRMNNTNVAGDETLRQKAASEPNCNIFYPAADDLLYWDSEITVKVLHACPEETSSGNSSVINNSSLVLKIDFAENSFLFTGDIDSSIEADLILEFGAELKATVLKVAHHGSDGSSTASFINLVHPEKAYIEVGASPYGHPEDAVLANLNAVGAVILRTDIDGTCQLTVFSEPAVNNSWLPATKLPKPVVYPNPCRNGRINFRDLPEGSIKIYNLIGECVQEYHSNQAGSTWQWNLNNQNGDKISSGTYFYLVTSATGQKKTGKFSIIK